MIRQLIKMIKSVIKRKPFHPSSVICPKCGEKGRLIRETTSYKGKKYFFYRVYHYENRRRCYITKALLKGIKKS